MDGICIEAKAENLEKVLCFVTGKLEAARCPAKLRNRIALAVEEIFANIAFYAYSPGTGPVTVRASAEGEAVIEFEDNGKPYNPLEQKDPDIAMGAREREVGGLGVYMVKNIMDTVEYSREGGRNILTLRKKPG